MWNLAGLELATRQPDVARTADPKEREEQENELVREPVPMAAQGRVGALCGALRFPHCSTKDGLFAGGR